jgi:hypothetical protein
MWPRCQWAVVRREKARPAASTSGAFGSRVGPSEKGEGLRGGEREKLTGGACRAVLTDTNELVDARHRRMPMCKRFRCLWSLDASC